MSDPVSSTIVEQFARDLRGRLEAANPIEALIAFVPSVRRTPVFPGITGQLDKLLPHPPTGISTMLVSGALEPVGRGLSIAPKKLAKR